MTAIASFVGGSREFAMRCALWLGSLNHTPTYGDVMVRFDCSRPTAYRILESYRAASGQSGN